MTIDLIPPAKARNWFEIWRDVWFHPGVPTFQSILGEPDHTVRRGLTWVAVISLITALVSGYTTAQTLSSIEHVGSIFLYYICIVILTPIFSIIGMIIGAGIYHWIARLLGGNGDWRSLLFCLSAISTPSAVVGIVIVLLNLMFTVVGLSALAFVIGILSIAVGIYSLVLYILAIQAAENIGMGRAVITVFIPVIIALIISVCIVLVIIPTSNLSL